MKWINRLDHELEESVSKFGSWVKERDWVTSPVGTRRGFQGCTSPRGTIPAHRLHWGLATRPTVTPLLQMKQINWLGLGSEVRLIGTLKAVYVPWGTPSPRNWEWDLWGNITDTDVKSKMFVQIKKHYDPRSLPNRRKKFGYSCRDLRHFQPILS
jgi:hypothetical protein